MEIRSFQKERERKALWSEDDRAQAAELLKCDPLYRRLPADGIPAIVDDALNIGRSYCAILLDRFGTKDPLDAARYMDVKIVYDISAPRGAAPFRVLSRYQPSPPAIFIYDGVLRLCRERIEKVGSPAMKNVASELTNICVAHELYHHLERKYTSFVNLGYKVPVINLGFIRIEKSLTMLSEIAAHAFSKSLLGLPFLPCVLHPVLFEEK